MWQTVAIAVVVALKFALPVLHMPFPFAAGWANLLLDMADGDILMPLGVAEDVYQRIDKAADWVTYIFMLIAGWRWPVRRWLIVLFVYRSIGQAAFFLTEDERVFFLFPNFLEGLFLGYASIRAFRRADAHNFYDRHRFAVWGVIVLYKLQDEWVTHIAQADRSDLLLQWWR
jgi:hypothetical protein